MLNHQVDHWLSRFEQALVGADQVNLGDLFHEESYWRDLLALSWQIETIVGKNAVVGRLLAAGASFEAKNFKADLSRTPPRKVTRVDADVIEAIFSFDTRWGRGAGVIRLKPDQVDDTVWRAWTFHTALDELKGHEERIGANRRSGHAHSRDFGGPNWLDQRKTARAYDNREPAVLVVGGGQAGLSIAARLTHLGVDTLIVDRHERIGDNWRKRYQALTLHNQVHVNHMPYMPFPPTWPTYIPKDMLANWFETYAESLELNFWTGFELVAGSYDQTKARWTATLRRTDESEHIVHPRHLVMATGVSGIPNWPDIPTLDQFDGKVLHASAYRNGDDWRGRKALVIGTGNSGHDIAQDLHASGAEVTLVQRSPTLIVNVEPSAQLPYALYEEGPPLEDCDLITTSMPLPLVREVHRQVTAKAKLLDKPLLDQLERSGFKLDFGEDGTGWQFKYLTRGGGYCFNVGCSDLIINGDIGLIQFDDIEEFVKEGALLNDDHIIPVDLIILATGYKGQEVLIERLLGADVADRVGQVWGFGDGLELRNMYGQTPQPGLWFIAGSFAQCRIYSKYLGLQIKAFEEGLLP